MAVFRAYDPVRLPACSVIACNRAPLSPNERINDEIWLKRPHPGYWDSANADDAATLGLDGWPDAAWHWSSGAGAPAPTPFAEFNGVLTPDLSSAQTDHSAALELPSHELGTPEHSAAEVGSDTSSFFADQWQQTIEVFQNTNGALGASYEPANDNSLAQEPANPLPSSASPPNLLAEAPNPPPAGDSIPYNGSDAAFGPVPEQNIETITNIRFIDSESFADAPVPFGDVQSFPAAYLPTANVGPGITISDIVTNPDGSITEAVSFAGSGLVFNNTLGSGVSQAYLNCILAAEQELAGNWTNSCTINESFVGQALGTNGTLASNSFYVYGVSYATLKNALTTLASQEPSNSILQQAVAHLPSSDPSGGQGFELALPYARILGLTSPEPKSRRFCHVEHKL